MKKPREGTAARLIAAAVALKIAIVALLHGFYDGEQISALTSPLHALLAALLCGLTRHTPEASTTASILADGVSLGAAVFALRDRPRDAALFAVVVAPMPFIALWTVGGLETPFLLALITALVLLVRAPARAARR